MAAEKVATIDPNKLPELSKELNIERLMSPLRLAMETEGITPDLLAKKLREELEATDTKFFAFQGMVVSAKEVIDWGTRQRARDSAHKLRGDYAPEAHTLNVNGDAREYTEEEEDILRKAAIDITTQRLAANDSNIALDAVMEDQP